ncbi:DNA adenine methylase [Luteimonas sp. 50]|uniref:DNA adenine methylase n=1 Tax=Cognatiluteimonas sedimenti TaxID=2927791 RepID=A0ABT0A1W0_9GAMM|nr:DNA adenine methylase [Lysobacter sedimenti]MCJ0824973.1 DNA adenine methylase [Lysobacter sedimenti]
MFKNVERVVLAKTKITQRPYPQYIKYMGSKSKIMDFVLSGINDVYEDGGICDLFGGSASLAGAVGDQVAIHSNDIQAYSAVLAGAYLTAWRKNSTPEAAAIIEQAKAIVSRNRKAIRCLHDYAHPVSIKRFNAIEREQQSLIERNFRRPWHLFLKYYSGTWWSAEQALWIDAIREVADQYKADPTYDVILSSLMFAMAYSSQGTGHYAQYRDANTASSMKDISIYRKKSVAQLFVKKYSGALATLATQPSDFQHKVTSLDYRECLKEFSGGTVYADPPYAFVHYSRFYHALETLVLYDYPEIQEKNGVVVKGRYRENRHQSPFCIRSLVAGAFEDLFRGVSESGSNLVLSYSNTGMISIDDLGEIASREFAGKSIELVFTDYKHMTLGRQFDRHREVEECLMLVK